MKREPCGSRDDPVRVLECVCKLRQPDLFKDYVLLIAGAWSDGRCINYSRIEGISDPKLVKVVKMVHGKTCEMIVDAQEAILSWVANDDRFAEEFFKRVDVPDSFGSCLPAYYRKVARMHTDDGVSALEGIEPFEGSLTEQFGCAQFF